MNRLERIQMDLQKVSAAIVRAERTAAQFPDRASVFETLRSIHKHRENLEEQFASAADEIGLDLCSYRVEYEDRRNATIAGITSALNSFQKIFTSVYDALVHGAQKKRATVSAEVIAKTAFGFAYTFPGSIGFMMTLANDRLLLDQTQLDQAMEKTFDLLNAQDVSIIEELTQIVGLPAVRLAHQWAIENSKASLGADIIWQRNPASKLSLRVQPQQIAALANAIGQATTREQIIREGDLVHVNLTEKTFEMQVDDKRIKGTFDRAISALHPVKLPARYNATLTVNTKVAVSEGEEDTSYFLVRLDHLEPGELEV